MLVSKSQQLGRYRFHFLYLLLLWILLGTSFVLCVGGSCIKCWSGNRPSRITTDQFGAQWGPHSCEKKAAVTIPGLSGLPDLTTRLTQLNLHTVQTLPASMLVCDTCGTVC